jgi:hypothetical protein
MYLGESSNIGSVLLHGDTADVTSAANVDRLTNLLIILTAVRQKIMYLQVIV